jgi:diguanylate cyclase (GGDEF)-like protein
LQIGGADQTLNDWHHMFNSIYGDRNSERDQFKIFAHLVEVAGGFAKVVRKGSNPIQVAQFLGKLLAWYSALSIKLGYRDIEYVVWEKYPYICPYCDRPSCFCEPDRAYATLSSVKLRERRYENRDRRPKRIADWQKMFFDIYGIRNRLLGSGTGRELEGTSGQLLVALNRFYEEMGELGEAIRLQHVYPIAISSELADVFAWIMAVANTLPLHLADPEFSMERSLWSQYPGECTYCSKKQCICANDRVRPSLMASAGGEVGQTSDALTGLPRKDAFERALADAVGNATEARPLSLILLDLDYFKKVNDTWGHSFGDDVIHGAADIFRRIAGQYSGETYRWGGEEFAVILAGYTAREADACTGRMLEELIMKQFKAPDGSIHRQSASAGIAMIRNVGGEAVAMVTRGLFDSADSSLYEAKARGRNCVVVSGPPVSQTRPDGKPVEEAK